MEGFIEFGELLMKKELNMADRRFSRLIKNFRFQQVLNSNNYNGDISNQINQSEVIAIDIFEESNNKYFVVCFDENIFIIDISNQEYIKKLFSIDNKNNLYISNEAKDDFTRITNILLQNDQQNLDLLKEEILNFSQDFNLCEIYKETIKNVWKLIKRCVSCYLIRKGYHNSCRNIKESFVPDISRSINKPRIFNEKEFVLLRTIDSSSTCQIKLAYYFKNEHLYCIKSSNGFEKNQEKLEIEIENYQRLYNPFVCDYYGTVIYDERNSLVIEFISGKTLDLIVNNLNIFDKYKIIFQIMSVICYLNRIRFIYRDLKPNNIIFNGHHIVLIDFDQMIEADRIDLKETVDFTRDFSSSFAAPEICGINGKHSYKTDIYSIGMMIYYILMETSEINQQKLDEFKEKYQFLYIIFQKCTEIEQEKRPDVDQIIELFGGYIHLSPKELIDNDNSSKNYDEILAFINESLKVNLVFTLNTLAHHFNDIQSQNKLGIMFFEDEYYMKDVDKAIYYIELAANQNNSAALYNLGLIYLDHNIEKALFYLNASSDQHYAEAQFKLGLIYYLGQNVPIDIEKAIYYYRLAADQNHTDALNNLGNIYLICKKDINSAIHYFTLAANLNDFNSCYNLGFIYSNEQYGKLDIEKALSYLQLAADNNIATALHTLGIIYSDGKYVERDVNKSIHYLQKAADKNYARSQFELGWMYFTGEKIQIDIEKAIKYFKLAADQNYPDAQYNLGYIYSVDLYVHHDSIKAINYLTCAANQDFSPAQFNLGLIYYKGIIVPKNIEKAIYFMKLAADKNNSVDAQHFLYRFYASGVDVVPNYKIALHYLTLASDQGFPNAQYDLGFIYYEAKHVPRDMEKAILLMTQAANQNYARAQYDLGYIYYYGKYIKQDVKKAINYFTLAAKQNHIKALIYLGNIYSDGYFVPIDVCKSIFYLEKAAEQNDAEALFLLGKIYFSPEYKVVDIKKSVHYMELAAGLNHVDAQNFLGAFYIDGKYVQRDIKKAIHYLTIAADKNFVAAQKNLGFIYLDKKSNEYDIHKAIHYFTLAAKNGFSVAQGALAVIYLEGYDIPQDIPKALKYLHLSAENDYHLSQRILGDLYLEGKLVNRDISKSIRYYKEALIVNDEKAKNNLAIIYKIGFDNVKKNILLAKEYLEEAIKQKNCAVSMFNLAKLCYFEEEAKGIKEHSKSIQLLIESFNLKLNSSFILLILILLKRFKTVNSIIIKKELEKINIHSEKLVNDLYNKYLLISPLLLTNTIFEEAFEFVKLYDLIIIKEKVFFTDKLELGKKNEPLNQVQEIFKINDDFYDGFGKDLFS